MELEFQSLPLSKYTKCLTQATLFLAQVSGDSKGELFAFFTPDPYHELGPEISSSEMSKH